MVTRLAGRVKKLLKSHGIGRVGSGRIGSDRVTLIPDPDSGRTREVLTRHVKFTCFFLLPCIGKFFFSVSANVLFL